MVYCQYAAIPLRLNSFFAAQGFLLIGRQTKVMIASCGLCARSSLMSCSWQTIYYGRL
jgi:hypothetical protein